MPNPQGSLILLNGFPGTGKLSIARAVQSKLDLRKIKTRLIDNHLIIDPAEAIHPGRGAKHKAFRGVLRKVVFDEIRHLPCLDGVVIMTLCLGENEEDAGVFAEHLGVSTPMSIILSSYDTQQKWVMLHYSLSNCSVPQYPRYAFTISCSKKEHMLRLQSPDRVQSGKTKLSGPAILESMFVDNKILDPTDISVRQGDDGDVELRHALIDTTKLSAEETALLVLDCIAQ